MTKKQTSLTTVDFALSQIETLDPSAYTDNPPSFTENLEESLTSHDKSALPPSPRKRKAKTKENLSLSKTTVAIDSDLLFELDVFSRLYARECGERLTRGALIRRLLEKGGPRLSASAFESLLSLRKA